MSIRVPTLKELYRDAFKRHATAIFASEDMINLVRTA